MNKNNLKSFNMNLKVAVKLTEAGKQHLIDYYSQFDYGKDYLKNCIHINGDVLEMQLYELMQVFGSQMVMGNDKMPFQSMDMLISENDLKNVKSKPKEQNENER